MQTHPLSHFREHRFAARFTPGGRIGLFDGQLSERRYDAAAGAHVRTEESVDAGEAWLARLREGFGIELPGLTRAERERLLAVA